MIDTFIDGIGSVSTYKNVPATDVYETRFFDIAENRGEPVESYSLEDALEAHTAMVKKVMVIAVAISKHPSNKQRNLRLVT